MEGKELDSLIEKEAISISNKLYEDSRELLQKAMKFVEESDFKQNELTQNVGKFFLKAAEKNDENSRNYKKMNFDYDLKKAKLADQNDDALYKHNEEFENIKIEMKQALHHPKLNEVLETCFAKIDDIEKEYRDFHDQNIALSKEHPSFINTLYLEFEKIAAGLFELLDISKESEMAERNLKRAEEKSLKLISTFL